MDRVTVTKTQLMQLVISRRNRECFDHSVHGTFDITELRDRMRASAIPYSIHSVALEDIVPHIQESRVVEYERVDSLPNGSWQRDPGIFLNMPDGTHLMIDGSHRALRRAKEGCTSMFFIFVAFEDAPRPAPGWISNPFVTWGDDFIDGKIVRKSA